REAPQRSFLFRSEVVAVLSYLRREYALGARPITATGDTRHACVRLDDLELHAAVLLPRHRVTRVVHRTIFSIALVDETLLVDAAVGQCLDDRFGAGLRQLQVVVVRRAFVGVTRYLYDL